MICSLLSRDDEALASVQDCVHFRCIRLIVDDAAVHFDPCVSLEGHLLRTYDHLRGDAILLQKGCRGCRALEAEHFFPVPNAGHVDCEANFFDRVWGWRMRTH